jgi:hypothetical protein
MIDEKGHFLQVATRSTRKARRINRIKPQELPEGTSSCASPSGRGLARRSGRSAIPRSDVGWPRRYAPLLRRTGCIRSGTGPELLPTFSTRARTRMGRI